VTRLRLHTGISELLASLDDGATHGSRSAPDGVDSGDGHS
jgi:hypothetical protein